MDDFTAGDIFFIIFILCVVHGIMLAIGCARRRKSQRQTRPDNR